MTLKDDENMPTRLTKEEREAIEWTRRHRKGVELRNKVVIGIAMLAWTVFIAGYVNYYMLLGIPTAYLSQFFSEIGLLLPLILGNCYIIFKFRGKKADAALVAWLVAATAAAVAKAAAAAAAQAAAAMVLAALVAMAVASMVIAATRSD